MMKDIYVAQHYATGKWYAEGRSPLYGKCAQWGQTRQEALDKLRTFVETHWNETWPELMDRP